MNTNRQTLIFKVLTIGILLSILAYFFHPGIGQFGLTINGEPVANPLIRISAFPSLLVVLLITGVFAVLIFFGVGILLVFGIFIFALAGTIFVIPYLWPMLVLVLLVVSLMSLGNKDTSGK